MVHMVSTFISLNQKQMLLKSCTQRSVFKKWAAVGQMLWHDYSAHDKTAGHQWKNMHHHWEVWCEAAESLDQSVASRFLLGLIRHRCGLGMSCPAFCNATDCGKDQGRINEDPKYRWMLACWAAYFPFEVIYLAVTFHKHRPKNNFSKC